MQHHTHPLTVLELSTGERERLFKIAQAQKVIRGQKLFASELLFVVSRAEQHLDDRFHESCHNVGIHLAFSDSYIGRV